MQQRGLSQDDVDVANYVLIKRRRCTDWRRFADASRKESELYNAALSVLGIPEDAALTFHDFTAALRHEKNVLLHLQAKRAVDKDDLEALTQCLKDAAHIVNKKLHYEQTMNSLNECNNLFADINAVIDLADLTDADYATAYRVLNLNRHEHYTPDDIRDARVQARERLLNLERSVWMLDSDRPVINMFKHTLDDAVEFIVRTLPVPVPVPVAAPVVVPEADPSTPPHQKRRRFNPSLEY